MTQYVSGETVILSIGGSRFFPYRVIPMDTHWFVFSQKNYIQQHEPRGASFKQFISTEPTLNGDDDIKLKLSRKTRALLVVVQT